MLLALPFEISDATLRLLYGRRHGDPNRIENFSAHAFALAAD